MDEGLKLPPSEILSVSWVFPEVFLGFPYEVTRSLPSAPGDLVVIVGKDRAEALREIEQHSGRIVAAFTPRDIGLRASHLGGREELPTNIVAAFATNNELADPRAVSLPLGVREKNLTALLRAREGQPSSERGLLYANFTTTEMLYPPASDGTVHTRVQLARRLRQAPWVTYDLSPKPRTGHRALDHYYSQIAAHRFVLSPPGRGIDCYRTWEALYLGAVPVVVDSPPMTAFKDLPILITCDYSELSEEYLTERWREMSSHSYEIARLSRTWYSKRFRQAVADLRTPGFVVLAGDAHAAVTMEARLRSERAAFDLSGETPLNTG